MVSSHYLHCILVLYLLHWSFDYCIWCGASCNLWFIIQLWLPLDSHKIYPILWRCWVPWLPSLRWRTKPEQFCFSVHLLWFHLWNWQGKILSWCGVCFSNDLNWFIWQSLTLDQFQQGFRYQKKILKKVNLQNLFSWDYQLSIVASWLSMIDILVLEHMGNQDSDWYSSTCI